MRVMHTLYGEGTVISTNEGTSTVMFDSNGKIDVPTNSLTTMIFS